MAAYHVPVLADESVSYLNLRPGGVYVDATFGGGGHSRHILEQAGNTEIRLFGFDQDEEAAANALEDSRFTFVAANFRNLRNFLRLYGVDRIDGLLADLGVSSHQFNEADRGFSFRFEAELDMRMGKETADRTAADIVNNYSPEDMQRVFGEYGEVRNARSLAHAIAEAREQASIVTIQDFLRVVDPWVRGTRPRYLAQVFQALRIEVNDEIGALSDLLAQATDLLIPQTGRLSVISYHSLEDRITKNFLKTGNAEGSVIKDFYGKIDRPYKILTKKPVVPSADECQQNSRARSAKLRAGERV